MDDINPEEHTRLVAAFTKQAAADFRQAGRIIKQRRFACCRYFKRIKCVTASGVLLAVLSTSPPTQAGGPSVGTPQAAPSSLFFTNGSVQVGFSATASGGDPFNDLKGTGFGSRIARLRVLKDHPPGTWALPSLAPGQVLDLISQFRPTHLNRFTSGPLDPSYVVGGGMTTIEFMNAAIARCANPTRDDCLSARLDWVVYAEDGTNIAAFISTAGAIFTNVYSQLSPPQRAIGIDEAHGRIPTNTLDIVSKALLAQGWKHIGWGANANTDVPPGDADWAMLSLNPTSFNLINPTIPSKLDSIGGYVSYQGQIDMPNNWEIMISNYPTADDQTSAFTTIAQKQTYPFIWVVAQESSGSYYDSTAITNSAGKTIFQVYLDLLNQYHVGTNYAWSWDFGDGAHSTNQTPVHTYYGAATATYPVIVIITDQDGNSDTNQLNLTIRGTPPFLTGVVNGGNLTLSWPSNYLGWTLQSQTNVLNTNWANVPDSTATNMVSVPVDMTKSSMFYRLFSPFP